MDGGVTKRWYEVRPGAPWDPEAARAAEVFAAYTKMEEARDARRRMFRAGLIVTLIASAVEAVTRWLSSTEFLTIFAAVIMTGMAAAIVEWRAEDKLRNLTGHR